MPELPEIETIKRQLLKYLPEQKLLKFEIKDFSFFNNTFSGYELAGQKVKNLIRKGKWLFFLFERNVLAFHLGLTGKLLLNSNIFSHVICVLFFEKCSLSFYDLRKFGKVKVFDYKEWKEFLNSFGKDALEISFEEFKKLINSCSQKIKSFLLDQKKISGIGNIYADEILFKAGISPHRRTSLLEEQEIKKLYECMRETLGEGIKLGGCSIRDYRDVFNQKGRFQGKLQVYGKAGDLCPRCRKPLKKDIISQRTTTYCSFCQK